MNTILKAAITIQEFCEAVSIGRSRFYEEVNLGRIKLLKSGRRTLVPVTEIQAWLDRLPDGRS